MSVDEYKESVKKRRQERLRLLRNKQRMFSYSPPSASSSFPATSTDEDGWSSYSYDFDSNHKPSPTYPFLIKMVGSLFLLAGVYMVMGSENPDFKESQSFVANVMNRELNTGGLAAWYKEKLGDTPVFLPEIIKRSENGAEPNKGYVIPVSDGKVVTTFGQKHQGIAVGTSTTVPVEVVNDGWVTFVGKKEGLGHIVIVEHGEGEESWYGQLQNVKVQLHDWVEQGQGIGSTSVSKNGEGIFFFAMKRDANFINPLDVIQFD